MNGGIFLSTDQVRPDLRNEFWRSLYHPIFEVDPASEGGDLRGSITVRSIGQMTITLANINPQLYHRNRKMIVDSGLNYYLLHLQILGSMTAECDGARISAGPGDICLFDMARIYSNDIEAGTRLSLAIPRERIDSEMAGRSVHGLLLPSKDPLTRMLKGLILDLHRDASKIDIADEPAVEEAAINFVATIIVIKLLKRPSAISASERNLRQRLLTFIDTHITEAELGTEMLIQHFQISRSHLYRTLAADGGVATAIRERRLDMAYRRLKTDENQSQSITELAYELGFTSSGQFSRAFRTQFGISPREAKLTLLDREGPGGPNPIQSHFVNQAGHWSA